MDECFYCQHNLSHPYKTADDDIMEKVNQNLYNQQRYEAQGVLTRANSELDFLKWLGGGTYLVMGLNWTGTENNV